MTIQLLQHQSNYYNCGGFQNLIRYIFFIFSDKDKYLEPIRVCNHCTRYVPRWIKIATNFRFKHIEVDEEQSIRDDPLRNNLFSEFCIKYFIRCDPGMVSQSY